MDAHRFSSRLLRHVVTNHDAKREVPSELLFVDDSRTNIDAAAALGFDVHLFDDPATLQPALAARGLL